MQVLVAGKPDTLHLPIEAAWHAFQTVDFLTAISFVQTLQTLHLSVFVFLRATRYIKLSDGFISLNIVRFAVARLLLTMIMRGQQHV